MLTPLTVIAALLLWIALELRMARLRGVEEDDGGPLADAIGSEGEGEMEDAEEDFACLPECRSRIGFRVRRTGTRASAVGRRKFRA